MFCRLAKMKPLQTWPNSPADNQHIEEAEKDVADALGRTTSSNADPCVTFACPALAQKFVAVKMANLEMAVSAEERPQGMVNLSLYIISCWPPGTFLAPLQMAVIVFHDGSTLAAPPFPL